MNTSDTNCKSLTNRKKTIWDYPPDRPWFEFVFITVLTFVCMLSIVSLVINANAAKRAQLVAKARLEVIYQDLKKNEKDLLQLKINHINDEYVFHSNLNASMKAQTCFLKRIAEKLNVPPEEINAILRKDPNY